MGAFRRKADYTDENINEISEYCNSHGIHIFDEEAMEICEKKEQAVEQAVRTGLSEEYKIRLKKARKIARFIMHLASVEARKKLMEKVGGGK